MEEVIRDPMGYQGAIYRASRSERRETEYMRWASTGIHLRVDCRYQDAVDGIMVFERRISSGDDCGSGRSDIKRYPWGRLSRPNRQERELQVTLRTPVKRSEVPNATLLSTILIQ